MYLFKYNNTNIPVMYKGNRLDSLAELKYIISVEDSHVWLRSDLTIHYKSHESENDISWNQYTPDFLVRNIKTNKAKLIEVKPDKYDDYWHLKHCKKVCTDHIQYFGYDWEFSTIYQSDIHLTTEQQERFYDAMNDSGLDQWNKHLLQNDKCDSDEDYRMWVLNGMKPAVLH